MYRGFIAAFSGEYRASARPGLAHQTRPHIFFKSELPARRKKKPGVSAGLI
jgi:hypothetical protein